MTDRRKVQMRFCGKCREYTASCPHRINVSPVREESAWGWVAFALFVGMGVVVWLRTCA